MASTHFMKVLSWMISSDKAAKHRLATYVPTSSLEDLFIIEVFYNYFISLSFHLCFTIDAWRWYVTDIWKEHIMAANSAKKFSGGLSRLARDINELRKDTNGLKEYDDLCDEQSALKREVEEKDREIGKMQQELDSLGEQKNRETTSLHKDINRMKLKEEAIVQTFLTQYKTWDADMARHSTETDQISQLRDDLQHWEQKAKKVEREKAQLHTDADNSSSQIEDLQKIVDRLERESKIKMLRMEDILAERDEFRTQLAKANKDIGMLSIDDEQTSENIDSFCFSSLIIEQKGQLCGFSFTIGEAFARFLIPHILKA